MFRKVLVIINPISGSDQPILSDLSRALDPLQIAWDVVVTHGAGDALRAAEAAARTHAYDAVAAGGGDGTVMEVAQALTGTTLPMIILPGGTANIVAKELQIPLTLPEALALFSREPIIRTIDTGLCNDRPFFIRINLGILAEMVTRTDRERKNNLGNFGYALSALESMLQQPTISRYTLVFPLENNRREELKGVGLMIANIGNIGLPGVSLAPSMQLDDGLLDVFVIQKTDLATLISVTTHALEAPLWPENIQHWQTPQVEVSAAPTQESMIDDAALPFAENLKIKICAQSLLIAT